jgi:hypothetical protein
MQVQSGGESRRRKVDDIDLFRQQTSYEDGDQSQQFTAVPTSLGKAPSKSSNRQYSVEYRSRDEVANAILKVRGKDKKAEYVNKQAEYLSKYNGAQAQRAIIISKVANKPAEIADAVTHSLTESTGTVEEQEYFTIQQVFSGDTQGDSLRIEHKKKPTNNDTGPKKSNTAGLFVSNVCHLIALLCQLLNKLT